MDEKVYSVFETHTDLIKRGKARKLVDFGYKAFLAESAQGLITDYQVLEGNPADSVQVAPSLGTSSEDLPAGSRVIRGRSRLRQR